MNKRILREFRNQKGKVWNQSSIALSSARSIVHFEQLEEMGLVRFEFEPEDDNYFDVYGRENISKKEDERIERMIDLDGLWYAVTKYWDINTEQWEHADSLGMLIGQDAHGYEGDLKQAAINALRDANRRYSRAWRAAS